MNIYIGIDNGVTGSICILGYGSGPAWHKTPTVKQLSYTKKKNWINRVCFSSLKNILSFYPISVMKKITLERPMINPMRWKASISAARALETTLNVIECLDLSYEYIDSKEWQKAMLPSGLQGPELKKASKDIAKRLFPNLKFTGDGDAICMCEYVRRKYESDGNIL